MLRLALYLSLSSAFAVLAAVTAVVWLYLPQLPPVESLRDVELQQPLRVLTADGALIAEFGEKRREPVAIASVPKPLADAFLAAEDDRFREHPGVDFSALVRAVVELARTGEKRQGGSTITMQVARNFFLSRDRTYERKVKEILLALKIERALSKDEILELYLNKIFLGQRAYGIAAAARVYYGVELDQLDLAQSAMLAGLPKAPSDLNPISNPERALNRRHYVLGRMRALGMISEAEYARADAAPITASRHTVPVEVEAPYAAEEARQFIVDLLGAEEAYSGGYRLYTTLRSERQAAANAAVRRGLIEFTERHGYRGPEGRVILPASASDAALFPLSASTREAALNGLKSHLPFAGLEPAVVLALEPEQALLMTRDEQIVSLPLGGVTWARKFISADVRGPRPETMADVLAVGDIVRIRWMPPETAEDGTLTPGAFRLAAVPMAESAMISLAPKDGRIFAMVGGFAFEKSKFNRATLARRQPGSNFKPFIYSAAIDAGFTPASFVNDAPIVFDAPGLESVWRPENYSGKYYGPTRLREALAKSRNLVSIRLLREVGIDAAMDHVRRFGFDTARLPRNLSLALGSGEVAPVELARAYAVLANGGFLVTPHLIDRIERANGASVWRSGYPVVCEACAPQLFRVDGEPRDVEAEFQLPADIIALAPRVLDAANAWTMTSMLSEVIRRGTGVRAKQLGRGDLCGKTGTTNDQKDAWFSGFNPDIVTTVWVGYDSNEPLGRQETGASAALPLWIDYMAVALDGLPDEGFKRPPGLVAVRINPDTGLRAAPGDANAIFEYFKPESVPESGRTREGGPAYPNQLF